MKLLGKYLLAAGLAAALALGSVPVRASEVSEPPAAICYLPTLADDPYIQELTRPRLYAAAGEALAASLPEDVTADYAGTYGIPARAERGYAFRITLSGSAVWEDGNPVRAGDVSAALFARLAEFGWIAGSEAYLLGWEKPAEDVVSLRDAGFSSLDEARQAGYGRFYIHLGGLWGLDADWTDATDRQRYLDPAMMPGLDEMYVTAAYLFRNYLEEGMPLAWFQSRYAGVASRREPLTAEDVGILVTGDRELVILTSEPMAPSGLASRLADVTALRAGFDGTYGAYRITDEGADEIRLERNLYWQGDASLCPADVIRFISR